MQQASLSQPSWALKFVYMAAALGHHHHLQHHHFPHLHSPAGLRGPEGPGELAAKARSERQSDPFGAEPRDTQQPTASALRTPLSLPPTPPPPSLSCS